MSAVVKRPDGRYNLRCGPEKFCWVVKEKKKKSEIVRRSVHWCLKRTAETPPPSKLLLFRRFRAFFFLRGLKIFLLFFSWGEKQDPKRYQNPTKKKRSSFGHKARRFLSVGWDSFYISFPPQVCKEDFGTRVLILTVPLGQVRGFHRRLDRSGLLDRLLHRHPGFLRRSWLLRRDRLLRRGLFEKKRLMMRESGWVNE